jgi:hypothetical protein
MTSAWGRDGRFDMLEDVNETAENPLANSAGGIDTVATLSSDVTRSNLKHVG